MLKRAKTFYLQISSRTDQACKERSFVFTKLIELKCFSFYGVTINSYFKRIKQPDL
jgi:hypothetical protein